MLVKEDDVHLVRDLGTALGTYFDGAACNEMIEAVKPYKYLLDLRGGRKMTGVSAAVARDTASAAAAPQKRFEQKHLQLVMCLDVSRPIPKKRRSPAQFHSKVKNM